MTAFLGDIEKSNDIEEDPNERTAIFIKKFVYLLDSELKKKSVSLCSELKIGNYFFDEIISLHNYSNSVKVDV